MENLLVPILVPLARLSITYNGLQGDLPDEIQFDLTDDELLRNAKEALFAGIPGIDPVDANLTNFRIDRFPSRDGLPNRILIRPETPFG